MHFHRHYIPYIDHGETAPVVSLHFLNLFQFFSMATCNDELQVTQAWYLRSYSKTLSFFCSYHLPSAPSQFSYQRGDFSNRSQFAYILHWSGFGHLHSNLRSFSWVRSYQPGFRVLDSPSQTAGRVWGGCIAQELAKGFRGKIQRRKVEWSWYHFPQRGWESIKKWAWALLIPVSPPEMLWSHFLHIPNVSAVKSWAALRFADWKWEREQEPRSCSNVQGPLTRRELHRCSKEARSPSV